MMKSRLKRLEDQARETDRPRNIFLGTEPTPRQLADLARLNLAVFVLPDNHRTPQGGEPHGVD